MNDNAGINDNGRVYLNLALPSGRTVRAEVDLTTTGERLIELLRESSLIDARIPYEYVSASGVRVGAHRPLGELFAPGASQADAGLRPIGPDGSRNRSFRQLLYGCPTAVTDQLGQLRECSVTQTPL